MNVPIGKSSNVGAPHPASFARQDGVVRHGPLSRRFVRCDYVDLILRQARVSVTSCISIRRTCRSRACRTSPRTPAVDSARATTRICAESIWIASRGRVRDGVLVGRSRGQGSYDGFFVRELSASLGRRPRRTRTRQGRRADPDLVSGGRRHPLARRVLVILPDGGDPSRGASDVAGTGTPASRRGSGPRGRRTGMTTRLSLRSHRRGVRDEPRRIVQWIGERHLEKRAARQVARQELSSRAGALASADGFLTSPSIRWASVLIDVGGRIGWHMVLFRISVGSAPPTAPRCATIRRQRTAIPGWRQAREDPRDARDSVVLADLRFEDPRLIAVPRRNPAIGADEGIGHAGAPVVFGGCARRIVGRLTLNQPPDPAMARSRALEAF